MPSETQRLRARVAELEKLSTEKDARIAQLESQLANAMKLVAAAASSSSSSPTTPTTSSVSLSPLEIPEILAQILFHVPFPSVLNLQRVCRAWKEALDNDPLLRWHCFRKSKPPTGFEHLLKMKPEIHPLLKRDAMRKFGLRAQLLHHPHIGHSSPIADNAFFERKESRERRYRLLLNRIELALKRTRAHFKKEDDEARRRNPGVKFQFSYEEFAADCRGEPCPYDHFPAVPMPVVPESQRIPFRSQSCSKHYATKPAANYFEFGNATKEACCYVNNFGANFIFFDELTCVGGEDYRTVNEVGPGESEEGSYLTVADVLIGGDEASRRTHTPPFGYFGGIEVRDFEYLEDDEDGDETGDEEEWSDEDQVEKDDESSFNGDYVGPKYEVEVFQLPEEYAFWDRVME